MVVRNDTSETASTNTFFNCCSRAEARFLRVPCAGFFFNLRGSERTAPARPFAL